MLPSNSVPALSRVLEWARHTVDSYHVSEILASYPVIMNDDFMNARMTESCSEYVSADAYDYNFVVPRNLVIKLNTVTENERQKRQASKYFNTKEDARHPEGTTKEIMAFFPGGTPHFTSGAIYRMVEFYSIVKHLHAWKADMMWLQTTKWGEISAHPELFDDETCTAPLIPHFVPTRHQQIADEIIKILQSVCLSSTFRLSRGECTVVVEKMVGMVARDRMLSDTIIDLCVRCICQSVGNSYALDSYSVMMGCPSHPDTEIKYYNYVVLPVHLSNIHWGVIIVDISYRMDPPTITPYFYEPLCSANYTETMEYAYDTAVAEFLKNWHNASMLGESYPTTEKSVWLTSPKQPDGTSCGVLIIAQIYTMLKNSLLFTKSFVSEDDAAIMRLRIMWMFLSQPEITTRGNKVARVVESTDIELLATIKT
ncbi:hypothetical protein PHMEG_00011575 [Phytophthora megakarya]|uniref:Ubiquitin-like protease family profile domain-containing protein n=1 Tax=Phytophthora megakarya TaxID=4795 RepID=A0A225WB77_9STRA|nr:hypothetical protein PHMEG_00011575 [Phytophthora megakarya]